MLEEVPGSDDAHDTMASHVMEDEEVAVTRNLGLGVTSRTLECSSMRSSFQLPIVVGQRTRATSPCVVWT